MVTFKKIIEWGIVVEIFIGRQPIFNEHEQIVAYELLYRKNQQNNIYNSSIDSDSATIDVIINSFLTIGMEEVTRGLPGFINFTEKVLMSELIEHLDIKSIVIEILEDIPITPQLIERIEQLKNLGFTIALDDFILKEDEEIYHKLFPLINIIKIDFLLTPADERMYIENKIKTQFPHIQLLAEKVETRNQYKIAIQSGYSLFQGYFFEKPQIIKSTDIPPNTLLYFQIISLLKEDEPNIHLLAETIERDISLSYKLLQLVNKSSLRKSSKIRSIKQAIMMLGLTDLRRFIYILALKEDGIDDTDLSRQLMFNSLFRAKVCELLARRHNKENFSEYFLVGMFSLIDALLKRPKSLILKQLPFSEEVLQTINDEETSMTPYLQFSIALGKLKWEEIDEFAIKFQLSKKEVKKIYMEANEWAKNAFS